MPQPTHGRKLAGRRVAAACACLGICALVATGCARARATTVPSLPELEVPTPPPRILMPIEVTAEVQEPPPPAPVPEEPERAPAPPRPRPSVPPPPTEAPKTAEEPPKPAPTAPVTTLQTTPAAEQGEVERAIRATMSRATADLNRIDYRVLNADARTQYDTAKRFIQQAEDAIRLRNLPFAKTVADKAAVLATQLGGR
jgi:hypothetical protein